MAVYCPEADTWAPASYPGLRRQRLGHGSCVAASQHGGIIYAGGGSAEVGGAGYRDIEWVEPGLPNEVGNIYERTQNIYLVLFAV